MDKLLGNQAVELIEIPRHFLPGLKTLIDAWQYAESLGRDRWDFAVELPILRDTGMSYNDFRWLGCRGYVEHAREITETGEKGRRFEQVGDLTYSRDTCFVLTDLGFRALKDQPLPAELATAGSNGAATFAGPSPQPTVPCWDDQRHELRLGDQVVKRYKLPSPNQERVLAAFQEENWPPRIDDPLPPSPDILPKRRLHDTIKCLNRHQESALIRFRGDGTGEGICWSLVKPAGKRYAAAANHRSRTAS